MFKSKKGKKEVSKEKKKKGLAVNMR